MTGMLLHALIGRADPSQHGRLDWREADGDAPGELLRTNDSTKA
jgi:hypothetical protein